MEKRLLLAFVLTILVLFLVPRIFMLFGWRPPTAPPRPVADTAVVADTPALPEDTGLATPEIRAEPEPVAPTRADGESLITLPAETTTVTTDVAAFRFSTRGAVPIDAIMRRYRSLRPGDDAENPVVISANPTPLLRYRVLTRFDTLRLDTLIFEPEEADEAATPMISFETQTAAGRAAITYSFAPDSYLVRVRGGIENLRADGYLLVDLPATLQSAEANPREDVRSLAYAFKQTAGDAGSVGFASLDPGERRIEEGPLSWVAARSKYFLVALLATPGEPGFREFSAVGVAPTDGAAQRARGTVVVPLVDGGFDFQLYVGPQEWRRLTAIGDQFENVNPVGGWFQPIVQPFATIVMRILLWMRDTLEINYGWILVIFGIVVRLLIWPLNQRAMRASLQMQRLQPQLQEVQKKYRGSPEKYQQEMMRIYREHGMSPFSPLLGCLPMLIPMPILFALFFVFQNTIEFRGVSFLWLPDISLKDPYYVIPILMGVSMYLTSWIGMRNVPPNPQTKMMGYVLPVMMTALFLNFASGLNLYYFVQNIAGIPQQWLLAQERAKRTG